MHVYLELKFCFDDIRFHAGDPKRDDSASPVGLGLIYLAAHPERA
jgi:hypothetical protein